MCGHLMVARFAGCSEPATLQTAFVNAYLMAVSHDIGRRFYRVDVGQTGTTSADFQPAAASPF